MHNKNHGSTGDQPGEPQVVTEPSAQATTHCAVCKIEFRPALPRHTLCRACFGHQLNAKRSAQAARIFRETGELGAGLDAWRKLYGGRDE